MMRWVKIEDVGDTEFLIDEQVDKFRLLEENERGRASGHGAAAAARDPEGVTLDRVLHLGAVVPGDDALTPSRRKKRLASDEASLQQK